MGTEKRGKSSLCASIRPCPDAGLECIAKLEGEFEDKCPGAGSFSHIVTDTLIMVIMQIWENRKPKNRTRLEIYLHRRSNTDLEPVHSLRVVILTDRKPRYFGDKALVARKPDLLQFFPAAVKLNDFFTKGPEPGLRKP